MDKRFGVCNGRWRARKVSSWELRSADSTGSATTLTEIGGFTALFDVWQAGQ